MTIEIRPIPGNYNAKLGLERWHGGGVLWLGLWYLSWNKH